MQRIEIKNKYNLKIIGLLEKPKLNQDKIKGTCILQHGWGDNKESSTIQAVKEIVLDLGFQTFVFDSTNSFGESDGEFEKSTLKTFYEDFEDTANWAKKQDWFIYPLIVGGHSKGGYSSIRYSQEYTDVDKIIAIAPVISGVLSFEAYKENKSDFFSKLEKDGFLVKKDPSGKTKKINWSQMEERLNHDLLLKVDKIHKPILFIVGSMDIFCPPKHIYKLFDAISSNDKKMEIIQNATHSFNKIEYIDACKNIIQNWLLKNS